MSDNLTKKRLSVKKSFGALTEYSKLEMTLIKFCDNVKHTKFISFVLKVQNDSSNH